MKYFKWSFQSTLKKNTTMSSIKYIFIIITLLISCRGHQEELNEIEADYEVNLDMLKNEGVASISSYFTSVKPIILETTEDNLIKSIDVVQITSDFIFILDRKFKKLYCFNKAGEFIRKIGRSGIGPGEFNNISDFTVAENDKLIFILDNYTSTIHQYKFSGEYISSINISNTIDGISGHIQYNNNQLFVDYQPNNIRAKRATPLLMKIDVNSGEKLDEFLSSDINNLGFKIITYKDNSYFYSKNSYSSYYAPIYSNTIFSIENNITPYFKIKSNRILKKEDIEEFDLSSPRIISDINSLDKVKTILNFLELEDYIICEYSDGYKLNTLIYSKANKTAKLYEGFFDDFIYKTFAESIPHYFACSGENGIYAYMRIKDVPQFFDYYESGKIKYNFDQHREDLLIDNFTGDSNPILFFYELH